MAIAPITADHNTSQIQFRPKIDWVPIDAVKPAKRRVRKHPPKKIERIAANIRRFGCVLPILVDRNLGIIGGHAVVEACRSAELSEVPVVRAEHLNEAEITTLKLWLNRSTEGSEWDWTAVALDFDDLAAMDLDFDLSLTGFDTPMVDWIYAEAGRDQSDPADEAMPAPQGPAVTLPGDLWLLDGHRIICGDARDPEVYRRLMDGQKARMVFQDCPYNVPIKGHVSGLGRIQHREFQMASGEMSPAEFAIFLKEVFGQVARHSMDGSVHFACMDWRHMNEMLDAGRQAYSELINLCVWNKQAGGMGSLYRSAHELIYVWKSGKASVTNNVGLGKSGRYRTNVLDYPGMAQFGRDRDEALASHPTVKPVALVHDLILDVSHRGEIVLDPFLGAGTTVIAAHRTGRRGYGIEIDPHYVDTAIRRMKERTGISAIHEATGLSLDETARLRAEQEKAGEGCDD
ncbi:site-specific DNA-methyltransferase [Flaviflagellibacter deserti]|uniref:Methyltransferase n=1 Tax=Flaviflagellibacter deserti TaxID=2267266 RepID=A0ABV9Z0S2_9HYPH